MARKLTEADKKTGAEIQAAIKKSMIPQIRIGEKVWPNAGYRDQANRVSKICNGKLRPSLRFWVVLDMFGIHVEERIF
jgi:hypothetical protein